MRRATHGGVVLVSGAVAYSGWRISNAITTGESIDMFADTLWLLATANMRKKALKAEVLELEEQYREDGFLTAKIRLQSKPFQLDGVVYPRLKISEGPKNRGPV